MAMIQPSFTSSKQNMGEFERFWSKNDGEKWYRNNIF